MGSEACGTGTSPGNANSMRCGNQLEARGSMQEGEEREKGGKDGGRHAPFPIQTTDPVVPRALRCVSTGDSSNVTPCISISKDLNGASQPVAVGEEKCCVEPMDRWLWGHNVSAEDSDGRTWPTEVRQASLAAPCHGGHTGAAPWQDVLPAETPARGLGFSTEGLNC